ncbi:MAG: DUF6065 family protein [Candidatus Binatia bacterium]
MDTPNPPPEALEIVGYEIDQRALEIRPAPLARAWMDDTRGRFAYRCLPLNLANQLGWELLCPVAFSAVWDGRREEEGVAIRFHDDPSPAVASHFGSGIVTIRLQIVFRTPAGHDLWVSGPVNRPKDGIAPLEGLVETDWLPFTFTMNWKLTRAHHTVTFEVGEPIARIVPYPRGYAERFTATLRSIDSDETMNERYQAWRRSREAFLADLADENSQAWREGWQRHYLLGMTHDGTRSADHRTKLGLHPFRRREPGPGR